MQTHFTAWLSTDRSVLEGDDCDVVILADDASGYRDEDETEPIWSSTGSPLFHALTGISTDGDPDEIEKRAEELLAEAGWRIVGRWDAVDTGMVVTVEPEADETLTVDQVADYIGAANTGSARKTLSRWNVEAVSREPGRAGKSLYSKTEVVYALATRPGQGARTDLKDAQ